MPNISVIVPVYKVEPYLRRCIDSILGQTYTDFELILVDDGSPDNCPSICDEYAEKDSRVHVIHQENGGLSAARNAGIDWAFDNSDSQWLSFIDSDDWVAKQHLELLYHAATMYNANISMCGFLQTQDTVELVCNTELPVLCSPEEAYTRKGKEISAFAWGRLFRKKCFDNHRFLAGKLFEDTYLIYKILFEQKSIAVIEQPLYYYYINEDGIVRSAWTKKKIDDLYDAIEEQIQFFGNNGYSVAENIQIRNYLCGIDTLYRTLSQNRQNNKSLLTLLKKKKRKNFRYFAKRLDINNEMDAWVLTRIYPKTMWFYWHGKALLSKLDIHKKRKNY